jgi:hypothetical protein
MSISSCPRCAQQVTLPMGISTSARVRCPLCRAEYALADALVNMPPILEVIGDHSEDLSADWFDMPAETADARREPIDEAVEAAGPSGLHLASESVSEAESFADEQSHDDLVFEAGEIEHDDSAMQQQDTEVEDLGFELAPGADDAAATFDPSNIASAEEPDVLDFGQPLPSAEPKAAADDELDIDFSESPTKDQPAEMSDFADDFSSPPIPAAEADELGIDFSESAPLAGSVDDAELDFGQPVAAQPDSEELSLDFGEPVAAAVPTKEAQAAEPPAGKKKKDKKEKKPKAEKPPADAAKKRSLVGLMLNVVLPAILAVPLALIGALWISPDYDFFGVGPKLASFGLAPTSFNKRTLAQNPTKPPVLPVANPPAVEPEAKSPADTSETPAPVVTDAPSDEPATSAPALPEAAAEEKPAAPSSTERATPQPPANEPEPTAPVAEAAEAPSEAPPVPPESATAESTKPAEPADASLDSLLADDAKKPEEMPDKKVPAAAKPEPAATEKTPEELPLQQAEKTEEVAAPSEEPGLRDGPAVTVAEVDKALHSFTEVNERMALAQAADDKAEIKKLRSGFYLSLYGLADAIALAKDDPASGQLDAPRESAERLALELAAEPTQLKELKSYGAKWLAFGKRTTEGVVLAGTVQSAEHIGKLYHVKIELAVDAPPQTLVTKNDPRVQAGDAVVSLGSIVKRPLEQLNGYEGNDSQVVWSGMTLKIPAQ